MMNNLISFLFLLLSIHALTTDARQSDTLTNLMKLKKKKMMIGTTGINEEEEDDDGYHRRSTNHSSKPLLLWLNGDKMHGFGVYRFANGHRYEGAWHEGRRQGLGMFTIFRNGETQSGHWQNGALDILSTHNTHASFPVAVNHSKVLNAVQVDLEFEWVFQVLQEENHQEENNDVERGGIDAATLSG